MSIALSTSVRCTFDQAVEATREALKRQGFGVLTEINVQRTLQEKIGAEMEGYLILGACNPALAHRALGVNRQIGLLLPCNVVVRSDVVNPGVILIEAMNPDLMVQVTDEPTLAVVAQEASALLGAAIKELSEL
ncbi:MAG: DUF302 domain-containing protein [Mycobacteriaceae bacterium]